MCSVINSVRSLVEITAFKLKSKFCKGFFFKLNFPPMRALRWSKNPLSSQTAKLMADTKFSDYLGLKHYKKAKKLKHFIHLALAYRPQSFITYHSISPTGNSG